MTGTASADYIQLYHCNASLLAESLEVIQQTASVILATLEPLEWPVRISAMGCARRVFDRAGVFPSSAKSLPQRRDILVRGLNQLGLATAMPRGSFYAFPDLRRIDPDSRKAVQMLLDGANIAAIPRSVFGPHG